MCFVSFCLCYFYLLDKLKGDLRCHPLSATFLERKNALYNKKKTTCICQEINE